MLPLWPGEAMLRPQVARSIAAGCKSVGVACALQKFCLPYSSQMAQLHENDAPIRAVRMMSAARRVAQIRAGWIHAVLVGESSFQDEDFLSAGVGMSRKRGSCRVPYETRSQTECLITHQVTPFNPERW
jgi:hypothetical protein